MLLLGQLVGDVTFMHDELRTAQLKQLYAQLGRLAEEANGWTEEDVPKFIQDELDTL